MSEPCSVCGDESVVGVYPLDPTWEQYLLETTDVSPSRSQYYAPVCQPCHGRFEALRVSTIHGSNEFSGTVLDDLDVERLLDDPEVQSGDA